MSNISINYKEYTDKELEGAVEKFKLRSLDKSNTHIVRNAAFEQLVAIQVEMDSRK